MKNNTKITICHLSQRLCKNKMGEELDIWQCTIGKESQKIMK